MSLTSKYIALFCNPTPAGKKSVDIAKFIAGELSTRNIQHQLFIADWPDVLQPFSEAWVVGGDGTLNYFLNKYKDISLPLYIFKGGSGNDFAWMLYDDENVVHQLDQALQGQPQWIDAGICNDQIFINGLGIGFDGSIVHELIGKAKRPGKSSYLLTVLKNIVYYAEQDATITYDGGSWESQLFMLSVANGKRYGGGFIVAPDADMQDGLLDLVLINKIKQLQRLQYLQLVEAGRHVHLPQVQRTTTAAVRIQSAAPLHAHLDGEYMSASLFEVQCLPKKYAFLV